MYKIFNKNLHSFVQSLRDKPIGDKQLVFSTKKKPGVFQKPGGSPGVG